jgi:hypothetical protein
MKLLPIICASLSCGLFCGGLLCHHLGLPAVNIAGYSALGLSWVFAVICQTNREDAV